MSGERVTPLAVALFEEYSRNCGHNPDEHFDRNAAEQWMAQALDACGVAELIALAHKVEVAANTAAYCYDRVPGNFAYALSELGKEVAQHRAALARLTGGA